MNETDSQSPDDNRTNKPDTFTLTRHIPVERGYDLVVAGGGPAGTAAAICAARLGGRVLLVEATGCLGGMGTAGLVAHWANLTDEVRPIIGGLMAELVDKLLAQGALRGRFTQEGDLHAGGFNPEAHKVLLDDLCAAAGVEVRFFTRVIDAEVESEGKQIQGVVLQNVEGYRYVEATTFVDATGDAVLADLCGAVCLEAGRDTPSIMPPTLCAILTGIDFEQDLRRDKAKQVEQAIADGFFSQPDRHVPGVFQTGTSSAILNAGHVFGMNALDCRSLSAGIAQGRKLAAEYTAFYHQYMPGCEDIQIAATAALMGVRESRRIVGEYQLCREDHAQRRHFPDQIAIYFKQTDIHVYDTSSEEYERFRQQHGSRLQPGENYGLPYGILVPQGWCNLWVAGRCNSSDLEVNGAIRDQPACTMMGQAAGTAAMQSASTGQPAHDLDTAQLVTTLREAGARLPQSSLSKTMTRS